MRCVWLKFAIAVAAASVPLALAAQNNQLFSPSMPPTAQAPRPTSAPVQVPPASVQQKPADAPKTAVTAPGAKSAQAPVSAKARRGKKKVEVAKEPELPPPPPPPPPTPEQMPANPPQVSYLNGQLTIQSSNATLSSILNAVRQQTGAQIELPPGSGSERVATRVGPGPARDVIASLLSGSAFDFLILGTPDSPGGVQRVILTPRAAPVSSNSAGMAQPPAVSQPETDDNINSDEEAGAPEPPDQQPPQPSAESVPTPPTQPARGMAQPPAGVQSPINAPPQPGSPVAPLANPQQQQPQASSPDQQGNNGPQVKTPEQMLQELQKLAAPKQ